MNEHIFATFALDKSESFCCVKPLYRSGFFQENSFCDLTLTYRLSDAQPWESETRKPVHRDSKDIHKDDYHPQFNTSTKRWLTNLQSFAISR